MRVTSPPGCLVRTAANLPRLRRNMSRIRGKCPPEFLAGLAEENQHMRPADANLTILAMSIAAARILRRVAGRMALGSGSMLRRKFPYEEPRQEISHGPGNIGALGRFRCGVSAGHCRELRAWPGRKLFFHVFLFLEMDVFYGCIISPFCRLRFCLFSCVRHFLVPGLRLEKKSFATFSFCVSRS